MILNNKQEQGLNIALTRYYEHEPYTVIAGYAGTGKSTLVSFIIEALDLDSHDVAYIAYTGKASLVLQSKGCPNATTAHQLLYKAIPRSDGSFFLRVKRPLDWPYKLIIVDEVSMLPKEMWELLLSHHIHVIALGDPGQLPPIGEENGVLEKPHIFLDEVMRQAQESEIIRLTMDIRAGKPLAKFSGSEVMIVDQSEMRSGMLTWADQIICGKNATRFRINDTMRYDRWGTTDHTPMIGDRVVCNHNDWEMLSVIQNQPLVNGTMGIINSFSKNSITVPRVGKVDLFQCGLSMEDGDNFDPLLMDAKLFMEHEPIVTKQNFRWLKNFKIKPFEYAYCITCHKSQGSEYNKVLVLEEYLKGNEHKRWLYTACTRAAQKLVIVRNYR